MESSLFSSCVFLPLPCLPLHFFLWFPLPAPAHSCCCFSLQHPSMQASRAATPTSTRVPFSLLRPLSLPPTSETRQVPLAAASLLLLPPGSFPFGPHSTFLPFLRRRPSLSLLLPTKCLWRHLTERRKNMPATLLSQKSVRYRNFSSYDKIYFSTATKIPTGNRSLKSLCRDGIS